MDIQYYFPFSEDHLLTSVLRYRQQIWWRWPFYALKWLLAIPVGLLVVFFIVNGLATPAAIFGVIIGFLLFGWKIDAWIIRRRFRKSPFHDDKITITLSDKGSHVIGHDSEVRTGWESYTKARRFNDGFLLFQGPHLFTWLPDQAALDQSVVVKAKELLRSHIPDYGEA